MDADEEEEEDADTQAEVSQIEHQPGSRYAQSQELEHYSMDQQVVFDCLSMPISIR